MYAPTSSMFNSRNSSCFLIKNPFSKDANILSDGLYSTVAHPKACRKLFIFQLTLEVMLINIVNIKNGFLWMKSVACYLLCLMSEMGSHCEVQVKNVNWLKYLQGIPPPLHFFCRNRD